jgi:hypothetical protein
MPGKFLQAWFILSPLQKNSKQESSKVIHRERERVLIVPPPITELAGGTVRHCSNHTPHMEIRTACGTNKPIHIKYTKNKIYFITEMLEMISVILHAFLATS